MWRVRDESCGIGVKAKGPKETGRWAAADRQKTVSNERTVEGQIFPEVEARALAKASDS